MGSLFFLSYCKSRLIVIWRIQNCWITLLKKWAAFPRKENLGTHGSFKRLRGVSCCSGPTAYSTNLMKGSVAAQSLGLQRLRVTVWGHVRACGGGAGPSTVTLILECHFSVSPAQGTVLMLSVGCWRAKPGVRAKIE